MFIIGVTIKPARGNARNRQRYAAEENSACGATMDDYADMWRCIAYSGEFCVINVCVINVSKQRFNIIGTSCHFVDAEC